MGNEKELTFKQNTDHCAPSHAHEEHHDEDNHCHGTVELKCNNHCHQLRTRSFVVNVPPQNEVQLRAFIQNTFNAWQNAGYLIMAHSVIDTGAGWTFAFTVGFYV